jgi:catechol 2,3-dioxygenase-like lactoylglutathione lyase family enzyme
VLEVLRFPPGKGAARWHAADALFLGIDHTAIVVADTDSSLGFWRDALGLRVAGGSENWGIEQERLNNVFGARLRITTLRGTGGPGVELLEYLAPAGGRPRPLDARANDLLHWSTTVRVADIAAQLRVVREARFPLVSADLVTDVELGTATTVGDADRHAVRLLGAAPAGAAAK